MSTPITADQFRAGQATLTRMRQAVADGCSGVIVSADDVRSIHRCALYLARQRDEARALSTELADIALEQLDYIHELEDEPEPPPPAAPAVVVVVVLQEAA